MDGRGRSNKLILFAWRRPAPPYFIGGAEISQALVARRLAEAGYDVRYLGGFDEPWEGGGRIRSSLLAALEAHSIAATPGNGGSITYDWGGVGCRLEASDRFPAALDEELARGPALVVSSQEGSDELLRAARATGIPTAGWIHSESATGILAAAAKPEWLLCVSRFLMGELEERTGRGGVLFYPAFDPVPTDAAGSRAGAITMVNPLPEKGGELFVELAGRMPGREFVAVDGWYRTELPELPNLRRYERPAPMEKVWRRTALLLVPSRLREGFGRVCVEAGQRGIPTLGSDRGGLPEAIGEGGLVLPPDDPEAWAEALAQALDPERYTRLSAAARSHATKFDRDVVCELRQAGVLG